MPGAYLPIATTAGTEEVGSPDVCDVPAGEVSVPTPFVNEASGATASGTSTTVLFVKQPALLMGSEVSATLGDEVGIEGGVASGTTSGSATNVLGSSKVYVEGKGVVLIGHSTDQNGSTPNCVGAVVTTANVTVLASP